MTTLRKAAKIFFRLFVECCFLLRLTNEEFSRKGAKKAERRKALPRFKAFLLRLCAAFAPLRENVFLLLCRL